MTKDTSLDHMVPIDTPAHITPDRLRHEAWTVQYNGDKYAARTIRWCADLIEDLQNQLEKKNG